MKAILMSIKPEWVEKILNGSKTIEIRKTKPKCELPCKVYIYCTESQKKLLCIFKKGDLIWSDDKDEQRFDETIFVKDDYFGVADERHKWLGKVVAEFTLNKVEQFSVGSLRSDDIEELACLSHKKMIDYFYKPEELDGNYSKIGYAWNIDDLIIYDTPKELSDFKKKNKCHYTDYEDGCCFENCTFFDLKDCDGKYSKITVAPQSWCYVEEQGEQV